MKVRYIYSACIEIETNNLRILCDPWFAEGIFDGSWYHFPKITNPLKLIKEPDIIYISHIHSDHYDPNFLKKLFKKYGKKPILIANFKENYLLLKSRFDGIEAIPTDYKKIKTTNIHIIPNDTGSKSDIDSALLVNCEKSNKTVLNLNDNLWNPKQNKKLKNLINKYTNQLDLIALSYAGAGPYPQTYYNVKTERKKLIKLGIIKKNHFFWRYKRICKFFPSKYHLPFAGSYILGGKLHYLNKYRGVSDPVEVTKFDKKAIILDDFGKGFIDLSSNKISKLRTKKYSLKEINKRINSIKKNKLDYEKDINIEYNKIDFIRLFFQAYKKAQLKSELNNNYYFLFKILDNNKIKGKLLINANRHKKEIRKINSKEKLGYPVSEITIDYRYLFGLLTGIYHWNNAEVGSLYLVKRKPDILNRGAQHYLNFLSIV